MRWIILLLVFVSCSNIKNTDKLFLLDHQQIDSLFSIRGISTYNNQVWVSGSHGKVYKSIDTGKSFINISPSKFNSKDFRDIHVFSENEAIIMSAGDSTVFLKTKDGGLKWNKVYSNNTSGIFFDALDFKDDLGYAISDPIKDEDSVLRFYLIRSDDNGDSWQKVSKNKSPKSLPNEAIFAASGSSLKILDKGEIKIVTGSDSESRCITIKDQKWIYTAMPFCKGNFSGAYCLDIHKNHIIAAGGSYLKPDYQDSVLAYSNNGGSSWQSIKGMGYFSGVHFLNDTTWIAAGSKGYEYRSINHVFKQDTFYKNLNVCHYKKPYFYIAGYRGQIIRFIFK